MAGLTSSSIGENFYGFISNVFADIHITPFCKPYFGF
jgi:hypothetical protein